MPMIEPKILMNLREAFYSETETVLKERTSLIVAHRLSTIVKADKIIVLQHGKIIEMGTHKELLKNRGYYFELYRNQFMQELENKMVKEM